MKTFYTERDIVDLHQSGVTEIALDDNVVLTDLAQEKAIDLGLRLKTGAPAAAAPPPVSAGPAGKPPLSQPEVIAHIKAGVIAKLGTTEYNDLLDQVIPQILARLQQKSQPAISASSPPISKPSEY